MSMPSEEAESSSETAEVTKMSKEEKREVKGACENVNQSTSSTNSNPKNSTNASKIINKSENIRGYVGDQDIDFIMNFIEGKVKKRKKSRQDSTDDEPTVSERASVKNKTETAVASQKILKHSQKKLKPSKLTCNQNNTDCNLNKSVLNNTEIITEIPACETVEFVETREVQSSLNAEVVCAISENSIVLEIPDSEQNDKVVQVSSPCSLTLETSGGEICYAELTSTNPLQPELLQASAGENLVPSVAGEITENVVLKASEEQILQQEETSSECAQNTEEICTKSNISETNPSFSEISELATTDVNLQTGTTAPKTEARSTQDASSQTSTVVQVTPTSTPISKSEIKSSSKAATSFQEYVSQDIKTVEEVVKKEDHIISDPSVAEEIKKFNAQKKKAVPIKYKKEIKKRKPKKTSTTATTETNTTKDVTENVEGYIGDMDLDYVMKFIEGEKIKVKDHDKTVDSLKSEPIEQKVLDDVNKHLTNSKIYIAENTYLSDPQFQLLLKNSINNTRKKIAQDFKFQRILDTPNSLSSTNHFLIIVPKDQTNIMTHDAGHKRKKYIKISTKPSFLFYIAKQCDIIKEILEQDLNTIEIETRRKAGLFVLSVIEYDYKDFTDKIIKEEIKKMLEGTEIKSVETIPKSGTQISQKKIEVKPVLLKSKKLESKNEKSKQKLKSSKPPETKAAALQEEVVASKLTLPFKIGRPILQNQVVKTAPPENSRKLHDKIVKIKEGAKIKPSKKIITQRVEKIRPSNSKSLKDEGTTILQNKIETTSSKHEPTNSKTVSLETSKQNIENKETLKLEKKLPSVKTESSHLQNANSKACDLNKEVKPATSDCYELKIRTAMPKQEQKMKKPTTQKLEKKATVSTREMLAIKSSPSKSASLEDKINKTEKQIDGKVMPCHSPSSGKSNETLELKSEPATTSIDISPVSDTDSTAKSPEPTPINDFEEVQKYKRRIHNDLKLTKSLALKLKAEEVKKAKKKALKITKPTWQNVRKTIEEKEKIEAMTKPENLPVPKPEVLPVPKPLTPLKGGKHKGHKAYAMGKTILFERVETTVSKTPKPTEVNVKIFDAVTTNSNLIVSPKSAPQTVMTSSALAAITSQEQSLPNLPSAPKQWSENLPMFQKEENFSVVTKKGKIEKCIQTDDQDMWSENSTIIVNELPVLKISECTTTIKPVIKLDVCIKKDMKIEEKDIQEKIKIEKCKKVKKKSQDSSVAKKQTKSKFRASAFKSRMASITEYESETESNTSSQDAESLFNNEEIDNTIMQSNIDNLRSLWESECEPTSSYSEKPSTSTTPEVWYEDLPVETEDSDSCYYEQEIKSIWDYQDESTALNQHHTKTETVLQESTSSMSDHVVMESYLSNEEEIINNTCTTESNNVRMTHEFDPVELSNSSSNQLQGCKNLNEPSTHLQKATSVENHQHDVDIRNAWVLPSGASSTNMEIVDIWKMGERPPKPLVPQNSIWNYVVLHSTSSKYVDEINQKPQVKTVQQDLQQISRPTVHKDHWRTEIKSRLQTLKMIQSEIENLENLCDRQNDKEIKNKIADFDVQIEKLRQSCKLLKDSILEFNDAQDNHELDSIQSELHHCELIIENNFPEIDDVQEHSDCIPPPEFCLPSKENKVENSHALSEISSSELHLQPELNFKDIQESKVEISHALSEISSSQLRLQPELNFKDIQESKVEISHALSEISSSELHLQPKLNFKDIQESKVEISHALSEISSSELHLHPELNFKDIQESKVEISHALSEISSSQLRLQPELNFKDIQESNVEISHALSEISSSELHLHPELNFKDIPSLEEPTVAEDESFELPREKSDNIAKSSSKQSSTNTSLLVANDDIPDTSLLVTKNAKGKIIEMVFSNLRPEAPTFETPKLTKLRADAPSFETTKSFNLRPDAPKLTKLRADAPSFETTKSFNLRPDAPKFEMKKTGSQISSIIEKFTKNESENVIAAASKCPSRQVEEKKKEDYKKGNTVSPAAKQYETSTTTMSNITELKSIIRGLLVSTQKCLTVQQLNKDFKDLEGRDIPLLGHPHLTSLLSSMPDTVRLQLDQDRFGRHSMFVNLIVSEQIAHLDKLVLKQRRSQHMVGPARRPAIQTDVRSNGRASRFSSLESLDRNMTRLRPDSSLPPPSRPSTNQDSRTGRNPTRKSTSNSFDLNPNARSLETSPQRSLSLNPRERTIPSITASSRPPAGRPLTKNPKDIPLESGDPRNAPLMLLKEKAGGTSDKSRVAASNKWTPIPPLQDSSNTATETEQRHSKSSAAAQPQAARHSESSVAAQPQAAKTAVKTLSKAEVAAKSAAASSSSFRTIPEQNAIDDQKRPSQSPNRAAVLLQSHPDASRNSQPSVSCDLGDAHGEVSKEPSLPKKVPIPPTSTKTNVENKSVELPYFPPAEKSKYNFVNNTNNKIIFNPPQTQPVHMQIYQQQHQVQHQQQMQQHFYHPNPFNVWPQQQPMYQPQGQYIPQHNFVAYQQFSQPQQFSLIGAGYSHYQMYPAGYQMYQNQQQYFNIHNQLHGSNLYQNQIANQLSSLNINKQNITNVNNNDIEIKNPETENKLSEISNTVFGKELESKSIDEKASEVILEDSVENEFNKSEDIMDRLAEVGSEIQELQSEDLDSKTEEGSLDATAVKSTVTEDDVPKSLSFATNYIIHDKTRQELRTLLKENPNGIWAADLLEKYKSRFHKELDIESYGFSTTMDMANNLQDIFQGDRPNQYSDFVLYDAQSSTIVQKNQIHDNNIPEKVKDNVESLLQKHPNGIKSNIFQRVYDAEFPQKLETKKYGYDNIDTFLLALNDKQVRLSYSQGMTVFPLVDQAPSPPGNAALPQGMVSQFLFSKINSELPEDVVRMREELPPLEFPEMMINGENVHVQAGEVYSPGRFYIQIFGKKYSRALEKMMNEMQEFYQIHCNSLRVKNVHEGLYIATVYEGEWHRGRVHMVQSQACKVVYIDYGTVEMCQIKELCYLHKNFSALPSQAILASLYNIKPCGGASEWPKSACYRFFELLPENINATVTGFDAETKMVEVCLVDTTGEEDIHINDTLVQEELAEFIVPPPPPAIEAATTSHPTKMVKEEIPLEVEFPAVMSPPPGFAALVQDQVDPMGLSDSKATDMLLRQIVDKLGADHVMEFVMSIATQNSTMSTSPASAMASSASAMTSRPASAMSLPLSPLNEQPSKVRGRRDLMSSLSQMLENEMKKHPRPSTEAPKKKPEVIIFNSDSDEEEIPMIASVKPPPTIQRERKYIINIDLGGICMHLLNVDRKALLLTEEVSRYIADCDMPDFLYRLGTFCIPYVILEKQTQPKLFQQLVLNELDWVITTVKGTNTVHLLPLTHLSSILKHLRINNDDIMHKIRFFLEHFDPEADYWFVPKN